MEKMIVVKAGKVINKTDVQRLFHTIADGDYRMTIEPYRVPSLGLWGYYWKVLVPMVKKGLIDVGYNEIRTDKDAHAFMKAKFLSEQLVSEETIDNLERKEPTITTLSNIQFTAYIEEIMQWAAEYLNVVIPNPVKQSVVVANYDEEVNAIIVND